MLKVRIQSRSSYQRSENLLGKTHCDRMTGENSKKEGYIDYSIRVMNNHAKSALTRPTGSTFSHINAR